MPEVSATEAARNFADILDAIEHKGETFTVVRRGKPNAQIEPVKAGRGADVMALLDRHRIDKAWRDELIALRRLLELDERA